MDTILCDELLQEIFHRLPSSSFSAVSLVSRRWLRLYRTSRTSLSLCIPPRNSTVGPPCVLSLLSLYPFLSSLSISSTDSTTAFSDYLLRSVSSSCSTLRRLSFLVGPVSLSALVSLSASFTQLTSLTISLSTPLFLRWVGSDSELPLESLCLSGLGSDVYGIGWLWRSCKKLRKLRLCNCESIGDGGSFSSFDTCIQGLQEVELRTCRSIVDGVLLKLAQNCLSLDSLLVYDGGSEEGFLRFINQCRCNLRKLDLRLPLDLHNSHLLAIAQNCRGLSCIRLQSCCLVTGDGLKSLVIAMGNGLEELALINCDVVERVPGMLTTLGQNLKGLRKLDLSYNEMLLDKEFISMLVSCNYLIDLRLRGCRRLTGAALVSTIKNCKYLESLDIMNCSGIKADAVEAFVLNSRRLRRLLVEESKLSVLREHGHQINLSSSKVPTTLQEQRMSTEDMATVMLVNCSSGVLKRVSSSIFRGSSFYQFSRNVGVTLKNSTCLCSSKVPTTLPKNFKKSRRNELATMVLFSSWAVLMLENCSSGVLELKECLPLFSGFFL
ncbi:F-box/LRR-repeat protein 4 [Vitis vinifera]|uniref:F-box/LRR-repeat protein 4 n=1 Tax=Vitis vinifera TaxID=29760 RepID=A0A438JJ13_VITVI|nr:F-box/LRR-repeat protein 4 [Vitis vinifera]